MAFDGTLKFDTAIDKTGFEAGLSALGSLAKKGMAVVTGAVTAVAASTTALTGAIVNEVSNIADYGDNIDKMSQKLGMSATAYQEWDAVMQHCGTSIDSLQAGMKTLASAAETDNVAFRELGISQEQIASMSQEELFSATITALQNVENETERTYLAGKLLGKGATELGALLNTSAEDTEKMKRTVHELGGVMEDDAVKAAAAFQDSLQDMQTSISGTARSLLSDLMPSMTTVMDGITDILSDNKDIGLSKISDGISELITDLSDTVPRIIEIGGGLISSLIQGIEEKLPELFSLSVNALLEAATAIVDSLPLFIDAGKEIIISLVSGIAEHIPDVAEALQGLLKEIPEILSGETLSEIASAAVALVSALASGIADTLPVLLDAALGLVSALGNAILDNIPVILPVLAELAVSIIGFLADGIPKVLETAEQLITKGVTEILPQVIAVIGEQLPKIITALTKAIPQIETALAKILPELAQTIVDSTPVIVQAFADIMPDILRALVDSLDEMYPAVHEAIVELITSLADLLPVIQEMCSELTPIMLSTLAEGIVDIAPDLLSLAVGVTTSIIKSVIEIAVSLIGNLLTVLGQSLADIGDILSDVLISAKEKAVTGVQNIISNVMEWLGTLPDRVGTTLGNVLGEIAKWAVNAPEKAKSAAIELYNNVTEWFRKLPERTKSHLEDVLPKIVEWGTNLAAKGKTAATELFDSVVNKISELPDKMLNIGRDIVTGIWNGISGAKDWLTGQISGFADGVISGFKDSFGIHSPSTLMRDQVGRYLAEGIGAGFAENMPDLSAMAQSAVDKLSEVNMPLLEIDIPDFDIHDNRRPPRIPQIDSTAYQALSGIGSLDRNIAPTSTAEIINNYSYSTTTTNNNSSAPETAPANITLNATFKVGEEVVAEGVVDIAADKIDERQGVTVELKKRGLAR